MEETKTIGKYEQVLKMFMCFLVVPLMGAFVFFKLIIPDLIKAQVSSNTTSILSWIFVLVMSAALIIMLIWSIKKSA